MAEFRINVIVDPTGAVRGGQRVERQLTRTGQAADRTRQLIARAFAFVGVAAGVRQLIRVADAFQNIQNRLRVVTGSQEELNSSLSSLEGIARRTRTSLDSVVALYQRGSIAANELGISNERLLGFVERVGQALAVQGGSAASSSGALLQLSQSLGSGIVRAEEFNSILEGAFPIALAAAQGIDRAGGSVARLRTLIINGEVTSRQFFEGFERGSANLGTLFERTVPTIGQAFTVLSDSITLFLGRLDSANGISASFARSILALSDNLDTLVRVAGAAALVIGTVLVRATARAAAGLVALALSNPFTAILLGATSAIALLTTFSDQILVGEGRLANLQDLGVETFSTLRMVAGEFTAFLMTAFPEAGSVIRAEFDGIEVSVESVLRFLARRIDAFVGVISAVPDVIVLAFSDIPASLELIFVRAFNAVSRVVADRLNFVINAINIVRRAAGQAPLELLNAFQIQGSEQAQELGTRIDERIADGIRNSSAATDALTGIFDRSEERARQRIAQEEEARRRAQAAGNVGEATPAQRNGPDPEVQEFLENLRTENDLLKLNSAERDIQTQIFALQTQLKRDLTASELTEVETLLRLNQAIAQQSAELDAIRAPQEDYANSVSAVNALLARNAITSSEAAARLRELRIAFLETQTGTFDGFERGFLRAQTSVEDFASTSERIITDAFGGAQDALAEFFQTGEINAESFFRTLAANFAQLAAQQALAAATSAFGGGGGGGGVGGGIGGIISSAIVGGLSGFQQGGSFTVGSGTAQAQIPGIDNRLIAFRAQDGEKVTVTPRNENGAGSGTINQVFNIQTPDADSFRRSETQLQNRANGALIRARGRR